MELVILTPAIVGFFVVMVTAGRLTLANQAADAAAFDAARTASLSRNATSARNDAERAAKASFESQGIRCTDLTVVVDPAGFSKPPPESAVVSVTVTCVVELSDVALVPLALGDVPLSASFTSPLDRYRERDPT